MKFNALYFTKYLLVVLFMTAVSQSAWARFEVAEYIYTAGNQATGNAVYGYEVSAGGELIPLPGSPYATGGLGNGISPFTQNGVVTSDDGRFLFAVNPGSDDIAVFRIRSNGRLSPVAGSPFTSGGTYPASIAISDDIVYVTHLGPNGTTLTGDCVACDVRGFKLRANGSLVAIPGAVVDLSDVTSAFPLVTQFNPDGDVLTITRFAFGEFNQAETPEILTYQLDAHSGLLNPAPGSPFILREGSNRPIGFTFNPVDDSQLFVTISVSSAAFAQGAVSTYLMADSGQIAELDYSPVAANTSGQDTVATCWVRLTSDGKHLYTSNTGTDNVSWYTVEPSGQLTLREVIDVPPLATANDFPVDMMIAGDDDYLYVVQTTSGNIAGWHISENGSLEELPNQPVFLSDGAIPYGLASTKKLRFTF